MNLLLDSQRFIVHELDSNESYAHVTDGSVGDDPAVLIANCKDTKKLVVRCGQPINAESDAAGLLASWSQAGWAQFDEHLQALDIAASAGGIQLMIRPSCDGILSDAICTMSWARRCEGLDCSLLLDPIGWITDSMIPDLDDHLHRIADLCSGCPKIEGLMIRSIKADESGQLIEASLGDGDIAPSRIIDPLKGLIQSAEHIIVLDSSDLDLLGL